MEEKISVIVPVYKVEKYIDACINSILNQTYTNLEIVLVNDGSPDNCPEIIEDYAKKDSRIKVLHKENGGLSSARNLGIKNATGKYLAFIDSDDTISLNMMEHLHKALVNNKADISVCQVLRVTENEKGEVILPKQENMETAEYTETIYSNADMMKGMLLDSNIGNFVCTKLFKKDLFDGIEFPEGRVYEDAATTYKVVHKAEKIVYINEPLYYYLIGRIGAITTTFTEKKILDSMMAYCGQYEFLIEHYPEIKEYASISWAKMFASAMEKILMNEYNDLWQSEEVKEKYFMFKQSMENISSELLHKFLEPYRLMSVQALNESMETYKIRFNDILTVKNTKK